MLLFTRREPHFRQSSSSPASVSSAYLFWTGPLKYKLHFHLSNVGVTITFGRLVQKPCLPTPHCLVIHSLCVLKIFKMTFSLCVCVSFLVCRCAHLCFSPLMFVFVAHIWLHYVCERVYVCVWWGCNSTFIASAYNFGENHQNLGWPEECLVGALGVSINPMKCCLC